MILKFAKFIRTITIPPFMALLMSFCLFKNKIIDSGVYFACSVLFLVLFPIIAYPSQKVIKAFRDAGRDGQRKLAFIFTAVGYTIFLMITLIIENNVAYITIALSYFMSMLLLTVENTFLHTKASGHSCSFTLSILIISYYVNNFYLIPGILAFVLIVWSSVYLKRHTFTQLSYGVITAIVSFVLSINAIRLLLI